MSDRGDQVLRYVALDGRAGARLPFYFFSFFSFFSSFFFSFFFFPSSVRCEVSVRV